MGFKCTFGMHDWDGCKCTSCGKTRDEVHDWSKDCEKCSKCGAMRTILEPLIAKLKNPDRDVFKDAAQSLGEIGDPRAVEPLIAAIKAEFRSDVIKSAEEALRKICGDKCWNISGEHEWSKNCEKCSKCGQPRSNAHTWDGCKCSKCGKTRDTEHIWDGCICKNCGLSVHKWDGCKCSNCGKTRDEGHDWSKDLENCSKCGKTRPIQYFEQERPYGDGACSWDPCPCGAFGSRIPRGTGHLYIPQSSVDFRRDCLTWRDYMSKLNRMADRLPPGSRLIFTDVPELVCEQGLKKLNIDPEIASADAKHWWATGLIPLRATPTRLNV